jgi:hypothetical protein
VEVGALPLHRTYATMSKEDPLQHLAPIFGLRISLERKLVVLIIVLH